MSTSGSSGSEWDVVQGIENLDAAHMEALIAIQERAIGAMSIGDLARHVVGIEAENKQLRDALETGEGLENLDSRKRSAAGNGVSGALTASLLRRKERDGAAAGLRQQVAGAQARLVVKQKGVDVCILMDCTGSMGNCIEAVKSKALDIMTLAHSVHPDALTRLAFVGYRDFGAEAGEAQFVISDFVDHTNFSHLKQVVSALRPDGGSDAEDVTGGLKRVLDLSWSSSTRLLIHFGDAPCHGNRYHNGRPVNGPDAYPAGNPDGLVPEDLLKQLVANRVDYHFARLCHHTDIMTEIFRGVYDAVPAGSAVFHMQEYSNNPEEFIPLVLNSITISMCRTFSSLGTSSSSSDDGTSLPLPGIYRDLLNPWRQHKRPTRNP